ncbi:MAG TPA: hypothetical protein VJC06_03150 [Candidatus Paceibacterota bacterium]
MMKNLYLAVMLCIWGTTLFAQTEIDLPPLVSTPIAGYMFLVDPPLTCQCLKTSLPSKKQGPILSLDIPISPLWDIVHGDRIKNNTIQFGGSAMPLKSTVMFGGWPVPRIAFATSDFRTTLEGGVMKTLNESFARTMEQVNGVFEGSIWYVLVGAEGLFGREEIPQIIKGVNFDADFKRRSYGGQGWLGLKIGDFNRNFVVGRYGMGYARTEGTNHFDIPGIGNLDWFPVYLEEFRTTSFSVEGKARAKRISQSVRLDRVEYERMVPSPDPLRFGENSLQDLWLRTETEVVPFSHARFLRGVVILTKDFKDQNRLMFINDYSSVRVLLRLAF